MVGIDFEFLLQLLKLADRSRVPNRAPSLDQDRGPNPVRGRDPGLAQSHAHGHHLNQLEWVSYLAVGTYLTEFNAGSIYLMGRSKKYRLLDMFDWHNNYFV